MNDLHNVYDLFYPSPPVLEKITMIKIAIELWRQEIRKHCANGTLKELDFEESTLSSVLKSYVPESILATVKECIRSIGSSIQQWIKAHTENHFFQLEILNDFTDFVGDFDGSIDYEKTAKKMILCDGISRVAKFKIACLYCFENEIALLWPSVSALIDLGEIRFSEFPHLFYWICHLKNQLYLVPVENFSENIRRNLFDHFRYKTSFVTDYSSLPSWSSIKYIFDHVNSEERMSYVIEIHVHYSEKFYRYVLAKLNKCEIDELLMKKRYILCEYDYFVRQSRFSRAHKVMAVWMYMKDEMKEYEFVELIQRILVFVSGSEPSVCCRIYATVPDNFKQSAIKHALLNNNLFQNSDILVACLLNDVSFLLMAISNASYDDRKAAWEKLWTQMMFVVNFDEFRQFVTLCFKNEEEIDHFKETHLSNYDQIGPHLLRLFRNGKFGKLNDFISYCFAEEQSMRDIRLRLLSTDFSPDDDFIKEPRALIEFINAAFNDSERATEFKNQFLSKRLIVEILEKKVKQRCWLRVVREFIDTAISKQVGMNFKKQRILPIFRRQFLYGLDDGSGDDYEVKFLRWCLENEDGNVDLSQVIPVDEIVQAVMRREIWLKSGRYLDSLNLNVRAPMTYHPDLVEFLKWYLVTNEAYENFMAKYANDDLFSKLTKPSGQDVQ